MKIFLIDDHSSVRESYKRWLENTNTLIVVGDSGNIEDAIQIIKRIKPDIILMDIDFPESELAGIEGCKKLKEMFPQIKIIFVTHYKEPEIILNAFKAGADGFFTKEDELKHLRKIIEEVWENKKSLSPTAISSIINFNLLGEIEIKINKSKPVNYVLNDEEQRLLKMIAQGLSNKEIANMMHTNEKKIKNEISNILSKTGAKNRAELIYITMKDGILE